MKFTLHRTCPTVRAWLVFCRVRDNPGSFRFLVCPADFLLRYGWCVWVISPLSHIQGAVTLKDITPPKIIFNSNLAKSRLSTTLISVAQYFWNFTQSTTASLPFSVQKFKMIGQLRNNLWSNEIARDLCLRWVSVISYSVTASSILTVIFRMLRGQI